MKKNLTEKQIEEWFIRPLCLTTVVAKNYFKYSKTNKRMVLDSCGPCPLIGKKDLKRAMQYIQNTLDVYKELKLTDKDIDQLNSKAYKEYLKEEGIEKSDKSISRKTFDLYLMQNTETRDLKIGISKNVERRREDLQSGSGRTIEILYIVEGRSDLELTLHDKFSHLRLQGEWFKYDESIIQEFENLTKMT